MSMAGQITWATSALQQSMQIQKQASYTNSYYYLGHFSKFILPGATRVATASNRDKLISTSFLNPNGELVVVVMNKSADKITFNLWMHGEAAETISLPHSISTYVIK
jgi:glucosylceramidase